MANPSVNSVAHPVTMLKPASQNLSLLKSGAGLAVRLATNADYLPVVITSTACLESVVVDFTTSARIPTASAPVNGYTSLTADARERLD